MGLQGAQKGWSTPKEKLPRCRGQEACEVDWSLHLSIRTGEGTVFVVLCCNFRSLAFLGLLGFLRSQLKI